MLLNFKALIVIFAIAAVVFQVAKPIALQFVSTGDFDRRRNLWFALTAAGLLSPTFWVFAAIAAPLLVWGFRKDTNPVALYAALVFVVPDVAADIPVVGINQLFQLDLFRLLALCVLVPAAWRLRRTGSQPPTRRLQAMDLLLIGFGTLRAILYVPPDPAIVHDVIYQNSFTNVLRTGFLFLLDVYVLYYVVSRFCTNRRRITEVLATFCLVCLVFAPIAVFESLRHWLLYAGIGPGWGVPLPVDTYFIRNGALRAQVTAGHAITLGYLFDIALGFWLYLQSYVRSSRAKVAVPVMLGLGLLVTYSRAPWLGALVIWIAYVALGTRSVSRLFKTACASAAVCIAIAISPIGFRIIRLLPLVGESAASDNSLQYREQLAERSWQLIQEHPLLGQQFVYPQMEDLRQGQGIIDFVNTYAQIALFYGGVGLFLFLGFIFLAVFKVYRLTKDATDPELRFIGRSLLAATSGTLLVIATGSLMGGTEKVFYLLAGLMCAYARLPQTAAVSAPSQIETNWISSSG